MFIKEADVRRLFKQAYKGVGLRIANDEHGLVLTGRAWHMYVFRENLPKEILGLIFALTGMLPDTGQQMLFDKDQAQMEVFKYSEDQDVYKRALEAQAAGNQAGPTDILVADEYERLYRVYEDSAGNPLCVPEEYRQMCDTSNCAPDEEYYGCYANSRGWLYWISDHMALGFPAQIINEEIINRAKALSAAGVLQAPPT